MQSFLPVRACLAAFASAALATAVFGPTPAHAENSTVCTANKFCYCINLDLKDAIEKNIAQIRATIARERALGKAIGYLSIPLSTTGGSYFAVNAKVSAESKARIEKRLGTGSAWILSPGGKDVALPPKATGADYMLMWTKVLEGEDGIGRDFDFIYFAGPSDFARHFSLTGRGDMQKIESYYDKLSKSDPGLKSVDKIMFRNYYALRASVSFSYGSHDEWNIARGINEKRRAADAKSGIPSQLGVIFDGQAVPPGMFEAPVEPGNAKSCN